MTILRLNHTAIAVRDIAEAIDRFQRLLGGELTARQVVETQKVEVAFLDYGEDQLELISPTAADTGVAKFLARRGEGLHHVAFTVDDIRGEVARLRELGVPMIDEEPRPGAHGLVAFVHPDAFGGVLVELVQ